MLNRTLDLLENWPRRADLNRGWRFCRQGQIVFLVDSSCLALLPYSSGVSVVLFPSWIEVMPFERDRLVPSQSIELTPLQARCFVKKRDQLASLRLHQPPETTGADPA